ncbi:helix-turn-helix domain-containing protein [Lichenibacterium ramalinae]|uniref:XRE family transcriptional regulator n=1 Tax=Lichenibacterium ramalinae TaxID=2316527 RepID=A0A4Q2RBA5_9HYPH|nr:helix-turn-helix transcriptional regulator [Lichenibacterium ramalinae]RYB04460.1 XRE family transcriptional regulator [Lichenibacterium ramalinae]
MDDRDLTELNRKLKSLRLAKRLSIAAVSTATGISRSHLWNLENRPMNPSSELLLKLASEYGASVADLVGENPDAENESPRLAALFREVKKLSERDLLTIEGIIKQFRSE